MKEIALWTRRGIINVLKDCHSSEKFNHYDVLDEIDFLSRLYKLRKMPSNDDRF